MTVTTSDIAYIVNATEGLGNCATCMYVSQTLSILYCPTESDTIPDNRTILLTPSNEIVTEMDTAAFVCVPANSSIQVMWSDVPNFVIGANTFYLTVSNVTENATIMCTVDVETANASLVVQGKSIKDKGCWLRICMHVLINLFPLFNYFWYILFANTWLPTSYSSYHCNIGDGKPYKC